ncbi:MAG: protein-methionine-sulfoxide reductase catalytic subunit MsrP [Nitrospinae bacterium]|nr:protein-methionine-sulfoxide reductase catalytic subunit MsrP [Nitrospinota bacterium]
MTWIKTPKDWELPNQEITPEDIYLRRREFLSTTLKFSAAALVSMQPFPSPLQAAEINPPEKAEYTPESIASRFNNFYEFGVEKDQLWKSARKLQTENWTIEVGGLVKKPKTLEVDSLIHRFPEEERVYRLRCVEAWSVVIPWLGFPLRLLIDQLEPLPSARYVKFTTFLLPNIALPQKNRFWEPWPYTEGLTLEEARHDLTFMATGIYGHPLPGQHGAPIRLVVPWKYGFKSIKSIVGIDFTDKMPETFYTSLSPLEYDFSANVNPAIPYARWHQAFERIPGKEETEETLLYNGYAEQVASMYP